MTLSNNFYFSKIFWLKLFVVEKLSNHIVVASRKIFNNNRYNMLYFFLGVLAPVLLNVMHLCVGIYITSKQSNLHGVGFSAIGFITKTIGMIFLTWLGVAHLDLNFRIFIPLLTFFWFLSHIVEAFVINNYMNKNILKNSNK